jgi:hypothetical protein
MEEDDMEVSRDAQSGMHYQGDRGSKSETEKDDVLNNFLGREIKDILAPYKGRVKRDAAFYYCPYIPQYIPIVGESTAKTIVWPTYEFSMYEKRYKPIDLATLRGLP